MLTFLFTWLIINQVLTALGELDYEDFKKPVEDFLQDYKADQERKKQRKLSGVSTGDDGETKASDAIERERDEDDDDIEDEEEDEGEPQEEEEPETSIANAEE